MVDAIATGLSMGVGIMGGVLWWAKPQRPPKLKPLLQRVLLGMVIGFLAYVSLGVSPINSDSTWNPSGIFQLLGLGYAGAPTLASLLPKNLAEQFDSRLKTSGTPAPGKGDTQTVDQRGGGRVEKRSINVKAHEPRVVIALDPPEKDAEYFVSVTPRWVTATGVVDKDKGSFTVEFGTHPTKDTELEFSITR